MTVPSVFLSYSHKDAAVKDEVLTHLGVLVNAGQIDLWNDDRLRPGADWRPAIYTAMSRARVALLLITAHFLTSKFILTEEVPALLQRRNREGLTIFPVIARDCAWQEVKWLADMQVRPRDGRPVWREGGQHVDAELAAITREVAALLREADTALVETWASPPADSWLRVTVTTPDRQHFAAEVPRDCLVGQLIRDLLTQWSPTAAGPPVRYLLRHPAWENRALDASLSLRETGLRDDAALELVAEPLTPEAPVGLTVEDHQGLRYTTAIRLSTAVGRLAEEFLRDRPGGGETIVELLGEGPLPHRLSLQSSLFEQGIGDGARLRVYRARENRQEA